VIALDVDSGSGPRRLDLLDYLEPAQEERAHDDAYHWIKGVRRVRVDGETFRSRFTYRGDSLWWFAELYLHKEQAILQVLRTLSAFDTLFERERPLSVKHVSGGIPGVIAHAAAARKVRYAGPAWPSEVPALARMDARAVALALAARLSRLRTGRAPSSDRAQVAAFVHRAFWRSDRGDGSAESYIGPVLAAIESRVGAGQIRYVGIGPTSNFRARRWWTPLAAAHEQGIVPVERYAPWRALSSSAAVFSDRHAMRQQMWASADLRAHAVVRGCDCWPLVKQQLAGIALLQFPWSARAMDEAGAALDGIRPDVAVTYAEAGGWGRALALEARRRGIPLAGLQHGFIYRHWLNYRHEPDEIAPDPNNAADAGFPFPATTLLFDEYASRQLTGPGRFPPGAVGVTGSARLDELIAAVRGLDGHVISRAAADAGATAEGALLVFVAKEREARRSLPALMTAIAAMPEVQLAIKPHPAETPDVYRRAARDLPNVRVLAAETPLPPLLAAARALVTVNSTVAIDALSLGIPSLVIGLPNNLTPFVDAGVMAGATSTDEIRTALARVLYDQEFRKTFHPARAAASGGNSAARSAEAILRLAKAKN
jgi:capsular polysaccharide biosynthesis protein